MATDENSKALKHLLQTLLEATLATKVLDESNFLFVAQFNMFLNSGNGLYIKSALTGLNMILEFIIMVDKKRERAAFDSFAQSLFKLIEEREFTSVLKTVANLFQKSVFQSKNSSISPVIVRSIILWISEVNDPVVEWIHMDAALDALCAIIVCPMPKSCFCVNKLISTMFNLLMQYSTVKEERSRKVVRIIVHMACNSEHAINYISRFERAKKCSDVLVKIADLSEIKDLSYHESVTLLALMAPQSAKTVEQAGGFKHMIRLIQFGDKFRWGFSCCWSHLRTSFEALLKDNDAKNRIINKGGVSAFLEAGEFELLHAIATGNSVIQLQLGQMGAIEKLWSIRQCAAMSLLMEMTQHLAHWQTFKPLALKSMDSGTPYSECWITKLLAHIMKYDDDDELLAAILKSKIPLSVERRRLFHDRALSHARGISLGTNQVGTMTELRTKIRSLTKKMDDLVCVIDRKDMNYIEGCIGGLERAMEVRHNLVDMELPKGVICPLTQDVMRDPVTAEDGHAYERIAIENAMHVAQQRGEIWKSPLTRCVIGKTLTKSFAVTDWIDEFDTRVDQALTNKRHKTCAK